VGSVLIGISGWRYAPWRGVFYPWGMPQREELAYASRQVRTIEINGSFYSLQRPESYRRWHDATPDDFVFSVKAPRYVTHLRRLRDIETPLANFFASGLLALGAKLGPILWQFPERFAFDPERFEQFFRLLPRDTRAAARMAKRHDERLEGRAETRARVVQPLRHAIEVRSATFANDEFVAMLRRHGIALVVADTAGKWPYLEDVTADFLYLRLHGDVELYESGYTPAALRRWAKRIEAWSAGDEPPNAVRASTAPAPKARSRDVYAYFDNDVKVHAPFDAITLATMVRGDGAAALRRRSRGPRPETTRARSARSAGAGTKRDAATRAAARRRDPASGARGRARS
jgi:uncharacterized protein YecE (DUF72 family)